MVGAKPEALEGLRGSTGVESRDDSVGHDTPNAQKIASTTRLNTGSENLTTSRGFGLTVTMTVFKKAVIQGPPVAAGGPFLFVSAAAELPYVSRFL